LYRNVAVILHLNAHAFERPKPRTLDIGADADTEIAPFLARTLLAPRKICVVRQCRGFVERSRVIAAVINDGLSVAEGEPDLVRHLFRLNEIAPANLRRIDLQFVRRTINQPLHHEHRLRTPRATHRRRRHLVRVRHRHVQFVGGKHVRPRHRRCRDVGHYDAPRHVRAGIVQHRPAHTEQLCVRVERNLQRPVLVALLRGRQKMFAPVFDPFHGPLEPQRSSGNDCVLAIEDRLRTETAADIGRNHANGVRIAFQQTRKHPFFPDAAFASTTKPSAVPSRPASASTPRHSSA
jgi:hypothetical protein